MKFFWEVFVTLFVIIDLYTPYTGIFTVSSLSARQALAEMLGQPDGTPPPWPAP